MWTEKEREVRSEKRAAEGEKVRKSEQKREAEATRISSVRGEGLGKRGVMFWEAGESRERERQDQPKKSSGNERARGRSAFLFFWNDVPLLIGALKGDGGAAGALLFCHWWVWSGVSVGRAHSTDQ